MDLNPDEQRLITAFRTLSPTAREDLLTYATSVAHRETPLEGSQGGQCGLRQASHHPEADKSPIFTE